MWSVQRNTGNKCHYHELCNNELSSLHCEFISQHLVDNINSHYQKNFWIKNFYYLERHKRGEANPQHIGFYFLLHSKIHLWQSSVAVALEFMDLHEKEIFLHCFWTMQSHVYSTWRNIMVRKFSHFFWLKWHYKHINFWAAATSSSGEVEDFINENITWDDGVLDDVLFY